MIISTLMVATLKIELISKDIFHKSHNNVDQNIIDIINVGSYLDIMNIQNSLIIQEDAINNNIKFLKISLKTDDENYYYRYRMFYER